MVINVNQNPYSIYCESFGLKITFNFYIASLFTECFFFAVALNIEYFKWWISYKEYPPNVRATTASLLPFQFIFYSSRDPPYEVNRPISCHLIKSLITNLYVLLVHPAIIENISSLRSLTLSIGFTTAQLPTRSINVSDMFADSDDMHSLVTWRIPAWERVICVHGQKWPHVTMCTCH